MTRRRVRVLAVGLGVLISVTGCVQEVPLVSEPRVTTVDTLEELRVWVGEQADATIAASEVPDGWFDGGNGIPEILWSADGEDRLRILGSLFPTSCGGSGAGQLDFGLKNAGERPDWVAVADRVWAFWEAEGWTVTDVIEPSDAERYFRADRGDGAVLSFRAAEDWLVISVHTSCSVHNTVTHWEQYMDRPNPFQEELDRRGQGGEQ